MSPWVVSMAVAPGRACACPCFRMVVCACTCLVAYFERSPTSVPPQMMKAASHAGAVAPLPAYGLHALPGGPAFAEVGNHKYSMLCRELLDSVREGHLPDWIGEGYYILDHMSAEGHGDVVEAALAAADCANAAEQHVADPAGHPAWVREYRDVVGGGCGQGDRVTAWIQERLHRMFRH